MDAMNPSDAGHRAPPDSDPAGVFFLLLFRGLVAYLILFACAVLMLRRPEWQLSVLDACFWAVLALLLVLQLRADRTVFVPFAAKHLGAGLAVWCGVNSLYLH
jgi:hypothetical protein